MSNDAKKNILFIAPRMGFFSRELLRGVLSLRSEGVDWQFWCLSHEVSKSEIDHFLEARKIDGIIGRGMNEWLSRYILYDLSIPTVLIRYDEEPDCEYINGPHVDDNQIGKLVGEEFNYMNLGYWGFIHWEGVGWSEARKKSFHSYATASGVRNEVLTLPEKHRHSWKGVLNIAEWVKKLPKPCGILACNDETGLDVINACHLAEVKVPDQVAVIGVDNDRLLCESITPFLSSIDLKAAEVGKQAVLKLGRLLGVIDHKFNNDEQPAQLVVRNSSNDTDRNLLLCQKAIDFIEARVMENLTVSDLVKTCGISRRGLERAFEKSMKLSPAQVIRERRIIMLKRILRETDFNLETIANQTGFSDASGLSNFIKRMTGKKPGDIRANK